MKPIALCMCGHPESDHEAVPTGAFASMRSPGCCKHCWKIANGGCARYAPPSEVRGARRPRLPMPGVPFDRCMCKVIGGELVDTSDSCPYHAGVGDVKRYEGTVQYDDDDREYFIQFDEGERNLGRTTIYASELFPPRGKRVRITIEALD